jgi:inner membrane protein
MDTITHAMTGLLIGHAAGEVGPGRRALWALTAMAPDLDSVAGLAGRAAYYEYHRAALHSLPGAALLAVAAGVVFRRLGLGRWRQGTAIAAVALASHLLLDTATSFGTRLWFPFDRTSVHWDLLFTFDPAFSALLIVCLGLSWVTASHRRAWGLIGLAVLVLYTGAAAVCRHLAEASVRAEQAAGHLPPGAVTGLPQPFWAGSWAVFVNADDAVWAGPVQVGVPGRPMLEPYRRPVRDRLLETALATPAAKRFLGFARFPHVARVDHSDGATFNFQDLRFSVSGWEHSNWWYGVRVDVGRDGVVRYAGFANP